MRVYQHILHRDVLRFLGHEFFRNPFVGSSSLNFQRSLRGWRIMGSSASRIAPMGSCLLF